MSPPLRSHSFSENSIILFQRDYESIYIYNSREFGQTNTMSPNISPRGEVEPFDLFGSVRHQFHPFIISIPHIPIVQTQVYLSISTNTLDEKWEREE